MKYTYFISYYSKRNGTDVSIHGNCSITRNKKIKSFEDIKELSKIIGEKNNCEPVVIQNYIRLKGI